MAKEREDSLYDSSSMEDFALAGCCVCTGSLTAKSFRDVVDGVGAGGGEGEQWLQVKILTGWVDGNV